MIVKQLEPPILLFQVEALNTRLPPNHRLKDTVSKDARILRAGYNGEKSLSYTLSLLDNPSLNIIFNLRIPDENGFFQIDNLILNRFFNVMSEVKNIYGTVTFDDMGQMIRTANDLEEGFRNPIEQIIKQEYRLHRWMKKSRLPSISVNKFVVFSNSSTIIKNLTNDRSLANIVIHEDNLFSKISSFINTYDEPILTTRQINRITKKLLDAHTPLKVNILEKYGISKHELIKGVYCEKCREPSMVRAHGIWKCVICGFHNTDAHKSALRDYALLIGKEINNRDARSFLNVDSSNIVKNLLKQENIEQIGSNSGTKYLLRYDDFGKY